NMAFFAASAVLRHVRLQASPLGPTREVVDYRDSSADPLDGKGDPREVTGNTWSAPPASWSEVPFVGEAYSGYLLPGVPAAPLVVADASAWVFQGTGVHDGSVLPAALATDFDQFDPSQHPGDVEVLAHSPIPKDEAETQRAAPFADMTYYTDPTSGAGVFDSGVNSWVPDLAPCAPGGATCPAAFVGQVTANVLRVFGNGPAGHMQPSVPNWQQFYP
ncbi:MAG TPA: N,N-dimethylformamidase beta subunit family domain-containing protein, partial [Acidimicrobiales bacterium]|nr:N,N-dimethylformamidase beta subunit family domain-containing protein [Acidimicrobiales bacterium]